MDGSNTAFGPQPGVWGCPCGFTGPYMSVVAHRHGWRKRPLCYGSMYKVGEDEPAATVTSSDTHDTADEQTTQPPIDVELETDDTLDVELAEDVDTTANDAELLAARLNAQKRRQNDLLLSLSGMAAPDNRQFENPGDFVIYPPGINPQVSQNREIVQIPVIIKVFYDWARGEGWQAGDNSMSAFVTDCLLDYFRNVLGKSVVVVDTQEVSVG